jgi:hypothetical protein
MILICLECAADMQEIKRNVFRCPCCGWGAEQLTIEGGFALSTTPIPQEVQQAWNTVAEFLNRQPELSFSINPWYRPGQPDERNQYTIESNDGSGRLIITADEEWRWKGPAPAAGQRPTA